MAIRTGKEYEVHYYEANYRQECTITAILNYLSDIGTKQSQELGVGMEYMMSKGLTWVFYKYDINIIRIPRYGEKLKVYTTALSFKKFYASRKYEIFDENNEKIVDGEGIFLLIDIERRRAVRIPDNQYMAYGVDKDNCPDIVISKLEKLKEEMYSKHFYTRYSDIDANRHVNNAKYVEWAIETVPFDVVINFKLKSLSVIFQKECTYGIKIKASCEVKETEEGLTILHKIENEEGKELTTLVTKWEHI